LQLRIELRIGWAAFAKIDPGILALAQGVSTPLIAVFTADAWMQEKLRRPITYHLLIISRPQMQRSNEKSSISRGKLDLEMRHFPLPCQFTNR
jgi:hypothetical protein